MHACVPLYEAKDRNRFGGKAAYLAHALASGLPIPSGFVIETGTNPSDAEIAAAVRALDARRLAVRSSSTLEGQPNMSAAGLFLTRLSVDPEDVVMAIREVRASVEAPQVDAYLARHGLARTEVHMAVIVQAMVEPRRHFGLAQSGTPPTVEAYDDWARDPYPFALDDSLFRIAESTVGGEVCIEWAADDQDVWVLQLRPRSQAPPGDFPIAFASREDAERRWRWDREHNPEPLSRAHESLIDRTGGETWRVFSGYLYESCDARPPSPPPLAPWFEGAIAPLEAREMPDPHQRLEAALDFFADFLQRYVAPKSVAAAFADFAAQHSITLSAESLLATTAGLRMFAVDRDQDLWRLADLARHVPGLLAYLAQPTKPAAPSPEMADWFADLRAHLDQFGGFAPMWDVAVPTYGEDPRPLYPALLEFARKREPSPEERSKHANSHAAEQQRSIGVSLPPQARREFDDLVAIARARLHAAEKDDLLFARALRVVRRPLLAIGRAWTEQRLLDQAADIFFLSCDAILQAQVIDYREEVQTARHEHARRRTLLPPNVVRGTEQTFEVPRWDSVITGLGIGGRARGRVHLLGDFAPSAPHDAKGKVLVVPTVLPQMTFLFAQASAVVADHGGRLDHGAVLAREYGLAAVVRTGNATRRLREGQEVIVDGIAGKVYEL